MRCGKKQGHGYGAIIRAIESLEPRRLMHAGHDHTGSSAALDVSAPVTPIDATHDLEHALAARDAARFAAAYPNGLPAAPVLAQAAADPAQVGQWGPVMDWPAVAVHNIILPSGKVMFWSYDDDPRMYDPQTGSITTLTQAQFNLFCTGHSLLADGRLFVAGGHVDISVGLPNASIYDPATDTWTAAPNMNAGRWYPTNTTLASGDVLVVSGDITPTTVNDLPQVYQVGSNSWRNLTGARRAMELYPFMYQAPNGKVFHAGPHDDAAYLDLAGNGAWQYIDESSISSRSYGSSVMYEDGKILIVGGGYTTATAEVINLNDSSPQWRQVGSMSIRRRQINATVLPDGQVLVTGGVSGTSFNDRSTAVYHAEMWNPVTEQFTSMASMAKPRWYHSTALLLPDGRILSAGGDDNETAEIYSPPYLFKGPRPTITSAPGEVGYGSSFTVQTPDAANIASISFIRFGAVTHAFNMDQRFGHLNFTTSANGTLNVTAPAEANRMPPGYYMMFAVDANGVPSVAKIVRLGEVAKPTVGISAADGKAIESTGDTAQFLFTRSNDDLLGDLVVNYALSGAAGAGDYDEILTGTITILNGQSSATLTITPTLDAPNEIKETLTLTLVDDADYTTGAGTAATVTIFDVPNIAPSAAISSPVAGANFGGGQTISFAGAASDHEDGALAGGSLAWSIERHLNGQVTVVKTDTGLTGSFVVPANGPADGSQFYRITLTATDSEGLTDVESVDITPRTSAITLATNIPGLVLNLDGQAAALGSQFVSVEGVLRTLGAPTPQVVGGKTYDFVSWSDAGAAMHAVNTPIADTTYTATFQERVAPPVTVTLRATADAYVRGGSYATKNYGSVKDLFVKQAQDVGSTRFTYLKFDLTTIGPSVTSAKIRLFGGMINTTTQTLALGVYGILTTNWDESSINYNNRPADDPAMLSQLTIDHVFGWREWDVTSYLQQLKGTGATSVSFVIKALATTSPYARFYSDEQSSNRPQLVVQTSGQQQPPPPPPPITSVNLRPVADATVRNGTYGGQNFGNDGMLLVKNATTANNTREVYLKFDLTTVTTITSAKLRLWGMLTNIVDGGTPNVAVYGATGPSWTETGLNYNNRPLTSGSPLATQTIAAATGQWHEWDLTSFLQAEKSAGRNVVTLVLKATNNTNPVATFNSDEASSRKPVLTIT